MKTTSAPPQTSPLTASRTAAPNVRSQPRIGFLGVGWIGRNRLQAIAESAVAEISCIADASSSACDAARECAPAAAIAASLEEALDSGIDGLVIATPSAQHADQARIALERGVAVFCQKPLARNAQETRAVIDAARLANRLLHVDLSYRFVAGAVAIRELIQNGHLGDIYAADLLFHNSYGPDKAWYYDPIQSGGGCVMDLGIHLVDLALWTLDFPAVSAVSSALFAGGKRLPFCPIDDFRAGLGSIEDFATAQMQLSDGGVIRMACSWNLPVGHDAVIEACFHGTRGGACLRNVNGSFYDFEAVRLDRRTTQIIAQPPDAWSGRAAVNWAQRLARDGQFDPQICRLEQVAEILDAIYTGGLAAGSALA